MAGCGAGTRQCLVLLVAGVLFAVLPQGRASISVADYACPVRDPYSAEDSPFGWPLTPSDWTWARPDCWDQAHLICGGLRQSPIDINLNLPTCSPTLAKGPDGVLSSPDVTSYGSEVTVNKVHACSYMGSVGAHGHFGHINLKDGDKVVTYEAEEVQVTTPSIHTIDGEHYDAELMVFHRPKEMRNMLTGGVIVSLLYRQAENESSRIFEALGFSSNPSNSDTVRLAPNWDAIGPINLAAEISPALPGISYLYNGSIPVPPCTENMKWIILGLPRPVTAAQLRQLKAHLERHGGGVQHRPAQSRDKHGTGNRCREIAVNSLQLGGNHEDATCQAAKEAGKGLRSARCWDLVDPCYNKRYSAVDIVPQRSVSLQDETEQNVHHGEKIVHYKAVSNVKVAPSSYSLDAWVDRDDIMQDDGHGNFGHLLLNGHIFFARSISVKPVSQHTVNGQHYAAELQIEHVLFGDMFGQGLPGFHRDLHQVMVSIFLKLGRANTFLRALEITKNKHSIRDKVSYTLAGNPLDLAEHLAPALSGPWYWYSSNSTRKGCGSSVRYMVFEVPLEVNLEQLNCLSLAVSGMESSQVSKPVPEGVLWKEHLPTRAVELNETDCGRLPKTDWKYGEAHPHWDHGNERCWTTGYPICGQGRRQSPIDIPVDQISTVGQQSFLAKCSWRPVSRLEVLNTGHNLQVNNNQMGYISFVGQDGFQEYYDAVQFHIHMPSEHMIGGRQYAAELHIVHKRQVYVNLNQDDDLLVTAIMFDLGQENSTLLEQLFLPGADTVLQQVGLNPKVFLADGMVIDEEDEKARITRPVDLMRAAGPVLEGPYYRYDGSLTTPPCSEAVKWFVFGTPLTMSQAQWLSFKALYPNPENNRPIQPVNDRTVALNSFEEGELLNYDFYLNRHTGRNRAWYQPSEGAIAVPIVATVILAVFLMGSLFVRESKRRQQESAGGLEQKLGKPAYSHLA